MTQEGHEVKYFSLAVLFFNSSNHRMAVMQGSWQSLLIEFFGPLCFSSNAVDNLHRLFAVAGQDECELVGETRQLISWCDVPKLPQVEHTTIVLLASL
jgi:hypothetical protein